MSREILIEFIEDAREHLEAVGQHVIRLEKDPTQSEELHGLLRGIHTIKGNAGFLNLNGLYTLLHKAENILQTVREQSCATCPPGLIDVLFQVVDTVEAMLSRLAAGESDEVDWLERLMASLDEIDATLNADPDALSDGPLKTAPGEREPAPEPPAGRVKPAGPATEAGLVVRETPVAAPILGSSAEAPEARLSENIEKFLEILDGEPGDDPGALHSLELAAEAIRVDVELWAPPEARQALVLLQDYLSDAHVLSRPVRGAVHTMLAGLAKNLQAWLSANAGGREEVVILRLAENDLEADGFNVTEKVRRLKRKGRVGLAFDLRDFKTIHSAQVGLLLTAMKAAPDSRRVGLVFDPESQSGLSRVFKIMALDRVFRMFPDAQSARNGLTP